MMSIYIIQQQVTQAHSANVAICSRVDILGSRYDLHTEHSHVRTLQQNKKCTYVITFKIIHR